MSRQLHLNLFIQSRGHHEASWRHPLASPLPLTDVRFYQDVARRAEAGLFDSIFLADQLALGNDVARAGRTWLEPITTLAALAGATRRIGLIATASTTYTEPYNLARQFASLDHLSKGRSGWNIVTSTGGGQNFGPERVTGHEQRYARAEEHVQIVKRLWDSWRDDALSGDRNTGIYAKADAIRPIGFHGQHFHVEGPLNIPRPPQGRPVLVQAGASETGRQFAAAHADVIFISNQNFEFVRQFYADMKRRVREGGRNPDHVRILMGCAPLVAPTEAAAFALRDELAELVNYTEAIPNLESAFGGVSLSGLSLDSRIPPGLAHAGNDHLVLALASRDLLAAMRYDQQAGRALMEQYRLVTIVLVYAESARLFHTRNPFAIGGVYEDPATGAGTAALAGYLRDLGWPHGGAIDVVQGEDMGMRSRLHADIGDAPGSSIRVAGTARFMQACP